VKNLYFSVILFWIPTVLVVSQVPGRVYTSEGYYYYVVIFEGQYCGEQVLESSINNLQSYGDRVATGLRLTRGQLECVGQALNRYEHSRGDTFKVVLSPEYLEDVRITVICEFSSNAQYRYWVFRNDR
jgi:hypothetical protein